MHKAIKYLTYGVLLFIILIISASCAMSEPIEPEGFAEVLSEFEYLTVKANLISYNIDRNSMAIHLVIYDDIVEVEDIDLLKSAISEYLNSDIFKEFVQNYRSRIDFIRSRVRNHRRRINYETLRVNFHLFSPDEERSKLFSETSGESDFMEWRRSTLFTGWER